MWEGEREGGRTSDRQLGTAGDELQELASGGGIVVAHNLDQVPDRPTLDIEAVVRLQSFAQR